LVWAFDQGEAKVRCTCLACLEGVRIQVQRGDIPVDDVEATLDVLATRTERRAAMLAATLPRAYRTRHEITIRMPTNWRPVAGWFESVGVEK
jgi:hypothetical protein